MIKLIEPGKATVVLGGQYGSEGKGAACAWVAKTLNKQHASEHLIVTTNAGPQSGHTSIHEGKKRVLFHLPTSGLLLRDFPPIYLNAGSLVNPKILFNEIEDNKGAVAVNQIAIHPNAAIVTDDCIAVEGRDDSAQTKIASTRKGVGEALSRKVLRSGVIARDYKPLAPFIHTIDLDAHLGGQVGMARYSVIVEVPQGISLSLNGRFFPYCTSRDCTVGQALSDAAVHPSFLGPVVLVLRTFPIRVGGIKDEEGKEIGNSGGCYSDQKEISWEDLGVKPEITTVTGRVRRVFTWSRQQVLEAMSLSRPSVVYLTFCDYIINVQDIVKYVDCVNQTADYLGLTRPTIVCQSGPTTDDAHMWGTGSL